MARVRIQQIRKSFADVHVLKNVSLDVADGEFLTLVGPSGCGKSTLLRIIAGLEMQDGGELRIGDRRVDQMRPKDRDVAMVFQSYALYPHMTVFDNIALPLRMRQLSAAKRLPLVGKLLPDSRAAERGIRDHVRSVAASLGIGHLLQRKPGQLSGGQRQRVALGRAIVRHPQVFLMDEPLSNLDAKLRVQMRTELAELHRQLRATFIYVTHDQAEAMTMSDRVAVMMDGELLQVDAPQQVYNQPSHVRVAEFIGSPKISLLPAAARADGIVEAEGLPLRLGLTRGAPRPVTIGIRPEALRLVGGNDAAWSAKVGHVEHLGADLLVHVVLGTSGRPLVCRLDPHQHAEPAIGETIFLAPVASRVHVFGEDGWRLAEPLVFEQVANG